MLSVLNMLQMAYDKRWPDKSYFTYLVDQCVMFSLVLAVGHDVIERSTSQRAAHAHVVGLCDGFNW